MKTTVGTWVRNTSGLEESARQRSTAARARVEEAIERLLRDSSQQINFNTVASAAAVTTAYFSEGAVAADARPQVCCFSGDLHEWSRPDAQHSPWFLPDCAVSPTTVGIRLDMDSARGSRLTFK